jgi:ABC-type phosphate transport system substrate-binding protein
MIYSDIFRRLAGYTAAVGLLVSVCVAQASTGEASSRTPAKEGDACEMPKASPNHPTGFITGAGAHFSWIIFDSLKSDLEKVSGRKIQLYGKDSMLGQGCNAGIKNARLSGPGKETFGFVCCPLSDEEVQKKQIQVHPLALEPILILVNQSNPVNNLSSKQVRDIFSGKITNWKEVGGNDQPIVPVTRLHCKKRPGHWKTILPSAEAFRKTRLNVSSADEMVKRVSDFKVSIGHTGATWLFETGNKVKHITVDGIAPTAENLKNKRYPFFRQLSAVTSLEPSEDVLKIIHETQTGPAFFRVAKQFNLLPLNAPRNN